MAQIDPNIALGFRMPQIQDPVAATGRVQEIGVNALKMQEMQRGIESQNKLRELYSQGVDVSTPEGFKQVAAIDPATALKLRTDVLQGQKLQGEIKKTGIETKLKELDVQREQFGNLVFNPSDANITAHIEDSVLQGKIPPAQAQSLLAQVLPLDTARRKQFFTDMAVKAETRFQGDITKRGQDISATTTRRGQDITDIRAREGQQMQYGENVVANTVTDAAGNVTQFNRFGQVIGKPGAVGKPSATFEKTAALQKQTGRDLDLAIKELTEATKDKGLIDQSTGSGAGRLVDVAAGFAGQATPGAIAIAKLKPIADMALKMVPRFEGPQSDKDTASYKEAAGQLADPSLPTQIRKEAGKEVLRLMKARKGQFVNEAMAAEGIGAGGVDTSNPLLK
jgi:hypothetical protein